MRLIRALTLAGLAVVLACATGEDGGGGDPQPAKPVDPADVVSVPEPVLAELKAFLARRQLLLADRVEVDASRIPFQAEMVPMNDPSYVESVEMAAPEAKAIGILMRSRAPTPMVERDFPRIQLGDGTVLLGTREIAVRTWTEVKDSEPVFLRVRGTGNAVYRDEESGRQIRKDVLSLSASILRGPSGYVFRSAVE